MWYADMERYTHGGRETARYDFSINLNPLGLMDCIKETLQECAMDDNFYQQYPPSYPTEVATALARNAQIDPQSISLGVGASELIERIIRTLKPHKGLILSPCFSEYERCMQVHNVDVYTHHCTAEHQFAVDETIYTDLACLERGDIFFLCTPNNPNGLTVPLEIVSACITYCDKKGIYLVIDISFLDFTRGYSLRLEHRKQCGLTRNTYDKKRNTLFIQSNVTLLLNTFTKLYAIPSLRIGYVSSTNWDLIQKLNAFYIPWSISTLAQRVAHAICTDPKREKWKNDTKRTVERLRNELMSSLSQFPITVFPSEANFILFQDTHHLHLKETLLAWDISLRDCANYPGLGSGYYRIAVKTKTDNDYLIHVLEKIYGGYYG